MRKFKKLFGIVTALMLVLTMLPTSALAVEIGEKVGSYSAYAATTSLTEGGSTSLTISTSRAAGKFSVASSNSSVASVSASSTWVDGSSMDPRITISAGSAGTATITVTPVDVSDENYNFLTNSTNITITVKEKATTPTTPTKPTTPTTNKETAKTETKKSSDATLKSITLERGNIDFKSDVTKYTVYVDKTVTSLGVKAESNDPKATVVITGDESFKVGTNLVKIKVTAEDGTTKVYEITVIKSKYGSGPLLDLKVKGYEITPEFDPSELEYSVDVIGVTSVELEYKLADESSTVKIEGADNLKEGMNKVTLTVTEKDGTVTTYTINVNVLKSVEEKNNTIWLIIIIILIILVVVETFYIVAKKKKESK